MRRHRASFAREPASRAASTWARCGPDWDIINALLGTYIFLSSLLSMYISMVSPVIWLLRDQALAICGSVKPLAMSNFGATSLTTLLQMVEGGLAKFRKDNALLSQLFVMDNKTPVADVVAQAAKDAGTAIKLAGFVRFQLGEGIEKQESDFAAEVAAAAGQSKAEPVA